MEISLAGADPQRPESGAREGLDLLRLQDHRITFWGSWVWTDGGCLGLGVYLESLAFLCHSGDLFLHFLRYFNSIRNRNLTFLHYPNHELVSKQKSAAAFPRR